MQLTNPASVFCKNIGGRSDIRTDPNTGGQAGVCVLNNGFECDEWKLYRGDCLGTHVIDLSSSGSSGGFSGSSCIWNWSWILLLLFFIFLLVCLVSTNRKKRDVSTTKRNSKETFLKNK